MRASHLLIAAAAAAVGLAGGCGQVSTQDDPTPTTAPAATSTTAPVATLPVPPTTGRATVTTSAVAAAAEANQRLCAAVALADMAATRGLTAEGVAGLPGAIAANQKADAGIVSAANTMVTTAAAPDVVAFATAAARASDSCTRVGHPTRKPTVIGPVQCVTTPCP